MTATAMPSPVIMPITGARTMNSTVLPMPHHCSELTPAWTNPAPTSPPIRACEEEVGKPQYQVMMSHAHAAISVAAMTRLLTMPGSMIPLPMVAATERWNTKKAMKLKKAAQMTACCGERTRVETIVATELAA